MDRQVMSQVLDRTDRLELQVNFYLSLHGSLLTKRLRTLKVLALQSKTFHCTVATLHLSLNVRQPQYFKTARNPASLNSTMTSPYLNLQWVSRVIYQLGP